MALLERVSTLVRANLNDLVDKAEDPEKMIKQVILDMQNQLLQVKTQVAIAIADQHVLEKKQKENEENEQQWVRRAELAVDKKDDDLARAALERSMSYKQMAESFASRWRIRRRRWRTSRSALLQAGAEAGRSAVQERPADRPAPPLARAGQGHRCRHGDGRQLQCRRLRPHEEQGAAHAKRPPRRKSELVADNVDDRFAAMEKEGEIDRLLAEIKSKRKAG